jgi:hypothetical protein
VQFYTFRSKGLTEIQLSAGIDYNASPGFSRLIFIGRLIQSLPGLCIISLETLDKTMHSQAENPPAQTSSAWKMSKLKGNLIRFSAPSLKVDRVSLRQLRPPRSLGDTSNSRPEICSSPTWRFQKRAECPWVPKNYMQYSHDFIRINQHLPKQPPNSNSPTSRCRQAFQSRSFTLYGCVAVPGRSISY